MQFSGKIARPTLSKAAKENQQGCTYIFLLKRDIYDSDQSGFSAKPPYKPKTEKD